MEIQPNAYASKDMDGRTPDAVLFVEMESQQQSSSATMGIYKMEMDVIQIAENQ